MIGETDGTDGPDGVGWAVMMVRVFLGVSFCLLGWGAGGLGGGVGEMG